MAMVLFLGIACTQQSKRGAIMGDTLTLKDYELVGDVKSVKEKSYGTGTIDGEPTNILYNEAYSEFDESGRLIYEKSDGEDGGYIASYEYDAEGKLIKFVQSSANEEETVTLKTYDDQGRLIRSDLTIPDSVPIVLSDHYKYDQNNNLIESTGMSEGSMGMYKTVNVYDEKNRLIETLEDSGEDFPIKTIFAYNDIDSLVNAKTYIPSGLLLEEVIHSYDENGSKVTTEHRSYDEQGNCSYARVEHYDPSGAITLQEDYSSEQLSYKLEKIYDAKGLLVEVVHYSLSDDNVMDVDSRTKYKYDDKGNSIEEVSDYPRQGNSQTLKRVYKYDRKGNWIRLELTQIYDGEVTPLKNVTEREITYHN